MQVALLHAPTIETCAFVLFVSTKSSGGKNTALARGQARKRIQTCMQQEDSNRYIFSRSVTHNYKSSYFLQAICFGSIPNIMGLS
jgi:hypothetical protein